MRIRTANNRRRRHERRDARAARIFDWLPFPTHCWIGQQAPGKASTYELLRKGGAIVGLPYILKKDILQ